MVHRWLVAGLLALSGCSQGGAPAPQSSPTATGAIPAVLFGRYGLTAAACDPGPKPQPDELRGLFTIAADSIAFGLVPQTVDRVVLPPGRIVFDTTDTSGDVTESRRYVFSVSADHRRLTRTMPGRPDLVYTRCAKQPS